MNRLPTRKGRSALMASLDHTRDKLHAGRNALQIPLPRLAAAADALEVLIDLTKKSSSKAAHAALARQIDNLAGLVERTGAQVQAQLQSFSGNSRRDLIRSLTEDSALSAMTTDLLGEITLLNGRAEELSERSCLPFCTAMRHKKILVALEKEVVKLQNDFQNGCDPTIKQLLRDANSISSQRSRHSTLPRPAPSDPVASNGHLPIAPAISLRSPSASSLRPFYEPISEVTQDAPTPSDLPDDSILEKLPRVDADFRASVNAGKSGYLEGTRQSLFTQLEAWAEGRSSKLQEKRICVLSGGAGTGKSTVAFEFARRLAERDQLGASFFFIRGKEDHNSTKLFFSVIAFQLAGHQAALRSHIVQAVRDHLRRGARQQMKYQAEDLLIRPLGSITDHQHQKTVTIVVDALDECVQDGSEDLTKMLEFLVSCTRKAIPLRVFLTSRPEHRIENILCSPTFSADIHTISVHDLPRESVDGDIKMYLTKRLSSISSSATLLQYHPDIVNLLTERAEGLFVYAQTVMNFLEHDPDHLMEQIGRILSNDPSVQGALEPLDRLYLTVLDSAFPPKFIRYSTPAHDRLQSILACVALLRDHLTPRLLEPLLKIPPEDSLSVLNKLRSVVLCGRDDAEVPFRPMHTTFSEFLIDTRRCTNTLYLVKTKLHQARLAEGCLRTLNGWLSDNMLHLTSTEFRKSAVLDLETRARTYVLPHVRYACVHWAAHLAQAGGTEDLPRLLTDFASGKMLMWLETLGYMDRLDIAEGAIKAAADSSQSTSSARELFDKGIQLVSKRFKDIDSCPHNVYEYGPQYGIVEVPSTPSEATFLESTPVTPIIAEPESPTSEESSDPESPIYKLPIYKSPIFQSPTHILDSPMAESPISAGSSSTPMQKSDSTASGKTPESTASRGSTSSRSGELETEGLHDYAQNTAGYDGQYLVARATTNRVGRGGARDEDEDDEAAYADSEGDEPSTH